MFTRGFSQYLNTTVITITGTIKSDLSNTRILCLLSDALTNYRCCSLVAAVSQVLAHFRLKTGRTRQNFVTAS